jgi:hypothetical protein
MSSTGVGAYSAKPRGATVAKTKELKQGAMGHEEVQVSLERALTRAALPQRMLGGLYRKSIMMIFLSDEQCLARI